MKKNAFTLLELLIVIIIVGILVALFLPSFRPARESALNDEARANLKLIQAAEKIYKLEYNIYFPGPEPAENSNVEQINQYLKLSLPSADPLKWNYSITTESNDFNATATRVNPPAGFDRSWSINKTPEEANCTGTFCR